MKFLKILLFYILTVLVVSFTNTAQSQTYDVQVYKSWTPSGVGYWTQGRYYHVYNDFDWMITRSVMSFNGYYYFDFWFFSQSYYWDGYKADYAATNIRNIKVYVDGLHYMVQTWEKTHSHFWSNNNIHMK